MVKDLVIIGGGPAGNAAALAAAAAGASSVAIVERDAFGGTCTNRGCIPTKFFLSRTAALPPGTVPPTASGEWSRLVAHKNALVRGLSRSIETRLASLGVEVVRGTARFVSRHEVEIADPTGGTRRLEAKAFVVATGSEPAHLGDAAFDGRLIVSSTDALALPRLPASLAVVGSGAVGSEFCFIFQRLGVHVTLLEAAERLFPLEDPDVDGVFRRVFERLGVPFHLGDPVAAIEKRETSVVVHLSSGRTVEAEMALVGVGRALASRGLGCEAAGIATGPRGEIVVGDDLRTSMPHIYAAGDVNGRMLLAHAASFMGEQASRRALGIEARAVPYRSIPWATFTTPEIAAVGLTLTRAEAEGRQAVAAKVPLMDSVKARIDRTTEGFVKVVAERGSGRLLGGTVVGPHASDLVHIIALGVHQGLTVSDMKGFTFVHPSVSELFVDLYAELAI